MATTSTSTYYGAECYPRDYRAISEPPTSVEDYPRTTQFANFCTLMMKQQIPQFKEIVGGNVNHSPAFYSGGFNRGSFLSLS